MLDCSVAIINGKQNMYGTVEPYSVKLAVIAGDSIKDIKQREVTSFLEGWKEYARTNRIFLVPGLYIEQDYLCLCLMDDEGRIIGRQRACHLNTSCFAELKRDSNINIIETPFAKIFLCPDVDIYKPEVIRAAVFMGAELVVSVQYIDPNRYNDSMIMAGPWQNAQQNCIYILNAHNLGGDIIGPVEASQDLTGFICRMSNLESEISAILSSSVRDRAYQNFPIFKTMNVDLYKRYFSGRMEI